MRPLNSSLALAALLVLSACTDTTARDEAHAEATAPASDSPGETAVTADGASRLAHPQLYMMSVPMLWAPPVDRENYGTIDPNPVHRVAEVPVSTFSIDVDTGSYSNVRRMLNEGRLPPQDAVRVEELVNYFDYAYAAPRDPATPFGVVTEVAPTPWNPKTRLLHIGIQGWKPDRAPVASNLVFLVDVSGSMADSDKLPLVKSSLRLLARQLAPADRISLVVYAGSTGVVLEPTPGSETATIVAALDRLEAGGSTNGGAGIALAYAMAEQAFIPGGNNRVLLATDGDFNVGTVSFEALVDLVEEKRKGGVALTTLGFGAGNYNDHLMEQLADAGNGNHAYIDSLTEAQRVLVSQRDATLHTIARDVKIQVEFNPGRVSEYRLIGYENRMLAREDFTNDQVDAGEIGAGHSVTALYEIALKGEGGERVEPLRYGQDATAASGEDELAFVKLRYKRPADGMQASSRLIAQPVRAAAIRANAGAASGQFRLAAAVAAYGQLLRGGQYTEAFDYEDVIRLASTAGSSDPEAARFVELVKLAEGLSTQAAQASLAADAHMED
ncbi:MAG TPA: VWA domain-containing protein [Steroidobacteraceae bacterium]|nr:VWA domain-containing protein [Steroidobacteraceae bacterium]